MKIIPSKTTKISNSMLYESLIWYKTNDDLNIKQSNHIEYAMLLYAIGYIDWENKNGKIRIYKIK